MTDFQPSGILSLDYVLGGGWPRGRVSELTGPRGSGRSTVALHAIAAAQRAGQRAYLLHNSTRDADRKYALRIGADVWPTRFDSRALLGTLFDLFENGGRELPELLVIELATDAQSDWQREYGSDLARFLRRCCDKPRTMTLLFVTGGGVAALEYYSAARVVLCTEGETMCGDTMVTAEVVQNKLGQALRRTSLQITPGDGVDVIKDLVRTAAYAGQVQGVDAEELCERLAHDEAARVDFAHTVRQKLFLDARPS